MASNQERLIGKKSEKIIEATRKWESACDSSILRTGRGALPMFGILNKLSSGSTNSKNIDNKPLNVPTEQSHRLETDSHKKQ